jgi:poly(A) polymerase
MNKLPSLARAGFLRQPGLQKLLAVIAAAGGEARVAGGAVRNALLKVPVADIDIATTLPPEQVTAACSAAGMGVHPTGIDHGTVTVVTDHHPYEVTTLRHDIETFGRHARVQYTDDWQADALRRDFTMNALYCDARGKIYDFTNGYADILRKRIRFVGSPAQRIEEDYLRILRFFRFHARFGKGAPDKAGLAACIRHRKGLDGLSAERLRQEMMKLIVAPAAVPTLKRMAAGGILGHILPYTEKWRVIARLPPDAVLRLAALAADPHGLQERLRLSNAEAERIAALGEYPAPSPALRPAERRAVLYRMGPDGWRDAVHMAWAQSRAALDDPAWRRLLRLPARQPAATFPVGGRDLMALGMAPGPELGQLLRRLEDWWVASDFKPDKAAILAWSGIPDNLQGETGEASGRHSGDEDGWQGRPQGRNG